jgi:hypothetical protein
MYEKLFELSNTFYFMLIELLVQEQCLFLSISEKHPDHFSTHCMYYFVTEGYIYVLVLML